MLYDCDIVYGINYKSATYIYIENKYKGDLKMEYAKDEIFTIRYNEKKDKLEFSKKNFIIKKIVNNKILVLLFSLGGVFSTINFILIYNFFNILKTI